MSRIDDIINNMNRDVNYIMSILITYRNIEKSGDCNVCGKQKTCGYCPQAGELVRFNCPFFERKED